MSESERTLNLCGMCWYLLWSFTFYLILDQLVVKSKKYQLSRYKLLEMNTYLGNTWVLTKVVKVRFCQKIMMFLSNQHFSFLKLKIWFFVTENCLEIENALRFGSLEAFKDKKVTFVRLVQPWKSPKFKFSVSGKKNVRLFGVMTKTSALSEIILTGTYVKISYLLR